MKPYQYPIESARCSVWSMLGLLRKLGLREIDAITGSGAQSGRFIGCMQNHLPKRYLSGS